MKVNETQLLSLLRAGQVTIVFTKVDGSEREMLCTLQDAYLPEQYRGKGAPIVETVSANFSVWDLEEQSWRSFRLDTVKSVRVAGISYSPGKSTLLG
jgi:WYL_2, Sm-like SH3 beta-barrel fold